MSSTTIDNTKVNWKDREQVKIYSRNLMRQRRGIKRHANIMEDGSLWSDNHPYGKFESNEDRLKNMRERRNKQPNRTMCHLCNKTYFVNEFDKHNLSKAHLEAIKEVHVPFF